MNAVLDSTKITLFSFTVRPVNDLTEGVKKGKLACHADVNPEMLALEHAEGEKTLYVTLFNGRVEEEEYVRLFEQGGLLPCRNGTNYLLGLCAAIQPEEFPRALINRNIVAAEPDNPRSVFLSDGMSCFLYVRNLATGRQLGFITRGVWWSKQCAFLAERR